MRRAYERLGVEMEWWEVIGEEWWEDYPHPVGELAHMGDYPSMGRSYL